MTKFKAAAIFLLLLSTPVLAKTDPLKVQECRDLSVPAERVQCFVGLAKQEKSLEYCGYFDGWASTKLCIEQRNQVEPVLRDECDTLGKYSERCVEYVRSGKLGPRKITVRDCKEIGPGYEGYDYCFMDLAQQEKSVQYCDALNTWSGVKECIYYVDRERKISEGDCTWLTQHEKECREYVKSGIPSKPGVSYENSQASG